MLLPEAFGRGVTPDAVLAVDSATRQIAGAASFRYANGRIESVRVRVIRSYRRKRVGTQLLSRICEFASARGVSEVWADADTKSEAASEAFLLANGFRLTVRLFCAEGDLVLLGRSLRRIRDRLLNAGKIPPAAKFVCLEEAPHAALAQMYADYIAVVRDFHPGYLLPMLRDPRLTGSSVLVVNGVVEGMLLCELNDGNQVTKVHARVVSPKYRGAWANCMLMLTSLERALAAGSVRVRFEAPSDNPDTLKLMARCNAEVAQELSWFVRDSRSSDAAMS